MQNDSHKKRAGKSLQKAGRSTGESRGKKASHQSISHQGHGGMMGMDRAGRDRQIIPPKRYRIGEIVEFVGVSRQTIHNYTTMGLLREVGWTRGGHRLYGEEVFERLDRIAELRAKQRSLSYIQRFFTRLDARDGGDETGTDISTS